MVRHSLLDTVDTCTICEVEGELFRVPSMVTVSYSGKHDEDKSKTGNLVKKNIEEFRSDLNRDKEKNRGKDYESDH